MKEGDKPEKSLAVRSSHEISVERAGSAPQFLAVGLTAKFFENLGKINSAIVRTNEVVTVYPPSVSMVLIPGENPVVETTFKNRSGLRIHIDSEPSKHSRPATTEVRVVNESISSVPRIVVLLSDIQAFVKKVFPDQSVILRATPYPNLVEKPESIDSDLNSVSQEMLQSTHNRRVQVRVGEEIVTRNQRFLFTEFEVLAPGFEEPIVKFRLSKENYDPRVFCDVRELYFSGESEKAESVLVAMTDLINKSYEELLPGVKNPLESGIGKSLSEKLTSETK